MAVVGVQGGLFVHIKVIAVFHKKLASAHHAETWPHFVTEFPLDLVKRQRQVFVAAHMGAENVGDLFLIGWAIQHIAPVAVGNAQHFSAVIVIAPAFAPQVCRLDGGHQDRDVAGARLFFMHDLLDLAQNLQAQRQPGIDTGAGLLDHASAQHIAMAYNLGLGRVFFHDGQEITGQTHMATFDFGISGWNGFRRASRAIQAILAN